MGKRIFKSSSPWWNLHRNNTSAYFLDFCQQFQEHPELIQTGWHKTLSQAFPDIHRAISDYENGKFVHSPTGAGDVRNSSFTEKLLYLGLILKIIMRNI